MKIVLMAAGALAVILLALSHTPGKTSIADAAGVQSFSIASVSCSGPDSVNVVINWPTLNQGTQYVYWSLQNNGFMEGTYTALGPLSAGESSAVVAGLPSSSAIYLMIGTVVGGQLESGQTMVFSTAGLCTGASGMPGYHGPMGTPFPSFLHEACNLFNQGYGTQIPAYPHGHPGYLWNDWDDEHDEHDEDEDEADEHDEDEAHDEDEDEADEHDEDEHDEDEHDEHGYQRYPGILSACIPQFGHQGQVVDWQY